ncbi:chaplin family protein [Streptomyces sp. NPDC048442]|uniref:chaplin n=1 Tax=Streptomyces sp. NPDC048442 TaxID=3154823 RepID=UPI0034323A57
MTAGSAFADAAADGAVSNSPGVGSGNSAQVPVHVPVNVCGNTVNVIGLLNPAFGNKCANISGHKHGGHGGHGAMGGGASADSEVTHSPGVVSGNNAQVPVHVPVNLCGNTANLIGALNPAFGNKCANISGHKHGGHGGHGTTDNGASADSEVTHSPGVVSGNNAQVPVHVPVNACGNTANGIAGLNPAFGNECANGPAMQTPPSHEPPADEPPADEPPADEPPADEPPADEPPADEPPADEPPADEPPADEPPADEPPVVKPPVVKPPVVKPPGKPTVPGKPTAPSKPSAPGKPHGKPRMASTGVGETGNAAALGAALIPAGAFLARRGRAAQR